LNNPKRKGFTFKEKTNILEKTDRRCAHCGKALDEYTMTVEHIYPISKGGSHDEFNILALCEDCNENKSNFTYSIDDYYNYIKEEYKQMYKSRLILSRSNNKSEKRNFLPFDSLQFSVLPQTSKRLIYQMLKRKNKKLTSEMVDRMSIKFKLCKAYPGDAKKIYELLNKRSNKCHAVELNEHMYTGEFSVLGDIYDHEVMILRKDREIHGAFIFKKVTIEDLDFAQLRTIEGETALRVKYIMTLAVVSKLAEDAFSDIMDSFYSNILRKSAIPLYFNILTDNSFSDFDRFIKIPYTIDKIDGCIMFPSLQLIREYEKTDIKESYMTKKDGEYDEDDLDKLVDYQLSREEELDDILDFPEEMQKVCERLGIQTRVKDFKKFTEGGNNG